ncbi:hypothetical protein N7504_007075 [Penicillium tannophilum]|nr:hypothetical protein N7504_007075 [Penicillium tannophilum]
MPQPDIFTTDDPDDETFHHPSWPERWTHPEFMVSHDERRAHWIQQPWWKDRDRTSVNFIGNFKWPWGFMIYRTVYTPESNEVWTSCLDKITRYIHWGIDHVDGERYSGQDPFPETIIKESYKNVIFDDRERWDEASWEQILADFNAYLKSLGVEVGSDVPRFTACLVIDEKCLQSIMRAFDNPLDQRGISKVGMRSRMGFVGMIDPTYMEGNSYCVNLYRRFMRVPISSLYELAARQLICFSMDEICPSVSGPGKVPVYNGSGGYEDDE